MISIELKQEWFERSQELRCEANFFEVLSRHSDLLELVSEVEKNHKLNGEGLSNIRSLLGLYQSRVKVLSDSVLKSKLSQLQSVGAIVLESGQGSSKLVRLSEKTRKEIGKE